MKTQALCWINGKILPSDQASVPVHDHGLLYGDGIFEGLRFYRQRIFMLDEHLARLRRSAQAIALELPLAEPEIGDAMHQLIEQSGQQDGYLRLVVTRGVGSLGVDPASCRSPSLFIIADTLSVVDQAKLGRGIRLHIAQTRRTPALCLDPAIKSLNYLNNILARIEANRAGADEALMLNLDGKVCEGSVDNLFIVRDGVIQTPPLEDGMLAGITRQVIIDLARDHRFPIEVRSLIADDLFNADECFLTGTGAELIKVRAIDDIELGIPENPLLPAIQQLFRNHIDEYCQA